MTNTTSAPRGGERATASQTAEVLGLTRFLFVKWVVFAPELLELEGVRPEVEGVFKYWFKYGLTPLSASSLRRFF